MTKWEKAEDVLTNIKYVTCISFLLCLITTQKQEPRSGDMRLLHIIQYSEELEIHIGRNQFSSCGSLRSHLMTAHAAYSLRQLRRLFKLSNHRIPRPFELTA
jgi:hypothetical protein